MTTDWGFGPGWSSSGGAAPGGAPAANAAPPASSPFSAARDAYMTYNAPALTQLHGANNGAYRNIGLGNDMLGLNQQAQQLDYQGNMNDLNTQMATNQLQAGRSGADAAAYGRMMGFNTDAWNAQAQGLGNTYQHNLFDINGQATANGAYTATGTNQQRGFNYGDFASQYGQANANYQQQQEQLGMRQGNSQVQQQVLERQAQGLGMKADQYSQVLQNGLAKLGLTNQISVGNLLDGIQNNNLQALQLMNTINQQAGQYATAAGQR